ncbi:hypothetical protein KIPB_002149, partial [Kipferlia bialata]|eukprot:g2149.t1
MGKGFYGYDSVISPSSHSSLSPILSDGGHERPTPVIEDVPASFAKWLAPEALVVDPYLY